MGRRILPLTVMTPAQVPAVSERLRNGTIAPGRTDKDLLYSLPALAKAALTGLRPG